MTNALLRVPTRHSTPVRSETPATSASTQPKKQSFLVDLHKAASMLGIPYTAVRRRMAEGQLPATRAGRGGKFTIARTALAKYSDRIK